MKRGYRPSYTERKILEVSGYDSQKYLISKKEGTKWTLIDRVCGTLRIAYVFLTSR